MAYSLAPAVITRRFVPSSDKTDFQEKNGFFPNKPALRFRPTFLSLMCCGQVNQETIYLEYVRWHGAYFCLSLISGVFDLWGGKHL